MELAMASMATIPCVKSSLHHFPPKFEVKAQHQWRINCAAKSKDGGASSNYSGRSNRKIWRRRQLSRKDPNLESSMERVPFLEEQVRRIRDTGAIMSLDIHKLMLSEENKFNFVNEVAAEATQYVNNNRDEYGAKKAILHVLSNRMNDAGFDRPEAYQVDDPFKPGPGFMKHEV